MPALRRQGQEALCKSEARLGYKVSSRAARIVTQINPVWERKKKNLPMCLYEYMPQVYKCPDRS